MSSIIDVAKRAGVSISTVSNVLNGTRYVSPELVKRVEDAVAELSYEVNPIARSMKNKKTGTIGVITEDMCGVFYPYVVKGINAVATGKGYQVIVCDTQGTNGNAEAFQREKEFFKRLIANRVDGIIFVSTVAREESARYFAEIKRQANRNKRIPLVSMERDFTDVGIDSVIFDGYSNARMALQHLIDVGCRRICHITGPREMEIVKERGRGFADAMAESGLPFDAARMTTYGDYTHQSGYIAMRELLEQMKDMDGVFCDNDQMAVGALKVLRERGIRVPEDIKLMGYDDVFLASLVEPSLSTIHIQKRHAGIRAAEMLFARIEEEGDSRKPAPIAHRMAGSLVVRQSTVAGSPEDWSLVDW
ncbi:MAG: LacI family DNA-binding transcriptional regulator [Clostridia bacterium]|nr:LacI family DNA-binding transcriptional regulator [Clostridia bacterium]